MLQIHVDRVLAPYLYYQHGSNIVIERADGKDRRIIPNATISGELTWSQRSSSGQWLAWTSTVYTPQGDPTSQVPGASSIRGQRVTILDEVTP